MVQRAARRAIWLPFIGGVALVIALVVLLAIFPDRRQPALIADFMLTAFILCPVSLCLLPIYLLLVLAVYGMMGVNKRAQKPLVALERTTANLAEQTHRVGVKAAKASVTFNVKMASVDRMVFSIYDRPMKKRRIHEQSTADDTTTHFPDKAD
jgi:hypothetical protein